MSAVDNLNDRIAIKITDVVFTMWTAYLFTILALLSLPAILVQGKFVSQSTFPHWLISVSLISLVAWVAQTFIQLVLLPIIGVGQKIQSDTTITALSVQADNKHNEIKSLHETLSRDISKLHSYFSKPKDKVAMSAIAEVKQLVETALTSVETELDNEVVQVVKAKLVDLQSFLSTIVDDAAQITTAPEVPNTPEPPVDPNAALAAPAVPPAENAADVPAETPAASDSAPSDEVPATDPSTETPSADEVTPPADGSEPVTAEDGSTVTDPNAPR